jgi:hypothetical protein
LNTPIYDATHFKHFMRVSFCSCSVLRGSVDRRYAVYLYRQNT